MLLIPFKNLVAFCCVLAMQSRCLLVATLATFVFGLHGAHATTYHLNINYNLAEGGFNALGSQYSSGFIPIDLPTLFAGDVINTRINFTHGLRFTASDPGSGR